MRNLPKNMYFIFLSHFNVLKYLAFLILRSCWSKQLFITCPMNISVLQTGYESNATEKWLTLKCQGILYILTLKETQFLNCYCILSSKQQYALRWELGFIFSKLPRSQNQKKFLFNALVKTILTVGTSKLLKTSTELSSLKKLLFKKKRILNVTEVKLP